MSTVSPVRSASRLKSASHAVRKASGIAPASSHDSAFGTGIASRSLHEIRAIERRRSHTYANLAETGLRLRPLLNLEDVGPARTRDDNGFHCPNISETMCLGPQPLAALPIAPGR